MIAAASGDITTICCGLRAFNDIAHCALLFATRSFQRWRNIRRVIGQLNSAALRS